MPTHNENVEVILPVLDGHEYVSEEKLDEITPATDEKGTTAINEDNLSAAQRQQLRQRYGQKAAGK